MSPPLTHPLPLCVAAAILFAVLCTASAAPGNSSHRRAPPLLSLGDVVVAAGESSSGPLDSVEVLNEGTEPALAVAVEGNSLSCVGSILYSCGGNDATSNPVTDCYYYDWSDNAAVWKSYSSLPVAMAHHASSVVGSDIWLSYDANDMYVLDTLGSGLFKKFSVPFVANKGKHCMASDPGHRYVVGVGTNRDEIWLNSLSTQPESWSPVATLPGGRQSIGCYLWGDELFITGGEETEASCLILDTKQNQLKECGDLETGRSGHAMFLEDGQVAVVGGFSPDPNNVYLRTMEIYDSQAGTWSVHPSIGLSQARANFGLAQLV